MQEQDDKEEDIELTRSERFKGDLDNEGHAQQRGIRCPRKHNFFFAPVSSIKICPNKWKM